MKKSRNTSKGADSYDHVLNATFQKGIGRNGEENPQKIFQPLREGRKVVLRSLQTKRGGGETQ